MTTTDLLLDLHDRTKGVPSRSSGNALRTVGAVLDA